ncbi:hypothetical protein [Flavobacterium mesophilum]|uniref:hypothetical protein n=1 Tax=Flavobacterium mesophilum TaxID=3143495 RepID=UPI0031DF8101
MSRETYVFIIDSKKAKEKLIPEIENNTNYNITLKEFIEDSNKRESIRNQISYEKIIKKISTDFNEITTKELAEIFFWLLNLEIKVNHSERKMFYDNEYDFYNNLKELGIELVYEMAQKDRCWVFMYQLGQYESLNKLGLYSDDDDWQDYEISNLQFKEYLDYLLLLLSKIEIENQNPITEVSAVLNTFSNNEKLNKHVDYSLEEIRNENKVEDEKKREIESQNLIYRGSYQCSYYYLAETMFEQISELKEKLKNYNGKILVIDSQ